MIFHHASIVEIHLLSVFKSVHNRTRNYTQIRPSFIVLLASLELPVSRLDAKVAM